MSSVTPYLSSGLLEASKLLRTTLAERRKTGGFTIIEALVALAIVAASLAAIGSLIATSARGTHVLEQHVALVETARAIMTGLPKRDQLATGDFSGELAGHRWQVDVLPFTLSGVDP